MKKVFTLLMLAALFAPLAMNAQRGIVQRNDVDLFSMPTISLSELASKDGDRATFTLLNESFEEMTNILTSYSATGWFGYKTGNSPVWKINSNSSYANSGSKSVQYTTGNYYANCYLVSAPFTVSSSMSSLSVSLYERTDQATLSMTTFYQSFEVFFVKASDVTNAAAVATATHYDAIPTASYSNTSFAQKTGFCTSSALAGQSVRVVVHCTTNVTPILPRSLYIDDIVVTENTDDFDCGVVSLPHFNGFESVSEYGCWTMSGSDMVLSSNNVYAGSTCLRINGLDNDQDQFLISPEFDGESAMQMSFYYRIANQNRDQFFYVGWGPDLSHMSWNPIEIAHNTTYQEYTEVFPKGTKYVVIAVYGRTGTSTYPSYMLIDNINFTGGCIRPRGLEADNITTKTADLTWGDYSDNGYNVRYRTKTIASATLANTRFEDKFNSSSISTSNWPNIQNQLYSSTATNWGIRSISGVEAYTGSYYASSRSYDGSTDHSVRNWLTTKSMTLGNVVKFYMNENYPAWMDHVDVCVGMDDMTFVVVAQPTVSSADWEEVTIDLSKYAGKTGYVAIVHEDEAKDYVAIDDFGVYTYNYTYDYGPWQYATAHSNSITLTGLTAETTYEVQVQSACGSDWSSAIDFTTPSGCTAPIDLTAEDITPYSATLSWSNYQDSYNVRYRGQIFYEGFDRGVPSDWTTINQANNGYDWMQWYGQDGTTGIASPSYINSVGNLTPDNWLITPQIDLGGYLEMWVTGWDANDFSEHFAVYLSTAGNTVSDFTATTPLLEENTTTNAIYQRRVIDLTDYDGQQGYIAIRHFGCTGQYRFCVENFGIYKTEDWLTVNPSDPTVNVTGLLFETEYVWQVTGDGCDNWSAPAYFTTLEGYIKHIIGYNSTEGNGANFYLIASPIGEVEPAKVAILPDGANNMVSGDYDLYYFDQARELEWITYKEGGEAFNPGFNLVRGKGYLYANSETVDLVFAGQAYTGSGNVTLTTTGEATGLDFPTWNLVGNPFAKTAYIDRDYYVMNTDGNEIITPNRPEDGIQAMEGCFVVATQEEETLTFSITAPTTGGGSKVVLNLSQDHKVIDRAVVRFGQGRKLPKLQLNPSHTKVYMTVDGNDYAVVSAEEQGEMPVRFKAEKNGRYTLDLNSENVSFAYLHLIDNLTGADVDLLETPSYSFEAKTTDYSNRFKLVFATGNNESDTFAFFSNGSFVINNDGAATLQVIDVTGRIVKSESINGCANVSVNGAAGVYMLRLINGDNVKIQKVVVK
jgi:hypothetical protein